MHLTRLYMHGDWARDTTTERLPDDFYTNAPLPRQLPAETPSAHVYVCSRARYAHNKPIQSAAEIYADYTRRALSFLVLSCTSQAPICPRDNLCQSPSCSCYIYILAHHLTRLADVHIYQSFMRSHICPVYFPQINATVPYLRYFSFFFCSKCFESKYFDMHIISCMPCAHRHFRFQKATHFTTIYTYKSCGNISTFYSRPISRSELLLYSILRTKWLSGTCIL